MSDSLWPYDCSPPGSPSHGILLARILEWVALPLSRLCSFLTQWLKLHLLQWTCIEHASPASPALADRFFTISNTWKPVFCIVSVNSVFLKNWIFGQQFTYFRFSFYFLWHISRHLIFNYTDIKRFIALLLS